MLLGKACDSLRLSIELFNRPHDYGRVTGVLIHLDHAFEMFLKAAIVQRSGRIREKRAKETIGFDACVRRSLSDGKIRFLSEEQAITLQTINGLRDAAQHYLLDISENQLYVHAQSGVTLFRDLLNAVFDQELAVHLPARVLPISTSAPRDLASLFNTEVEEIRKLLGPRKRRRTEAEARLRPLAILDATIKGEKGQPSSRELSRIGQKLAEGKPWAELFEGAAAVEIIADGAGPTLSLRLSKKEGIPVHLVPEGTPGASIVGVRRVDELGFYSLGAKQLAEKLGLSLPKTIAVIDYLGIRRDVECYKEFKIGASRHKRYSQKAIGKIKLALKEKNAEEIWAQVRETRSRSRR